MTVFVAGALSIAALGAASLTFAAHFTVIAFLAGLAAVSTGRRVLADFANSPTLFSRRDAVLATTCTAGITTGLAACILAGLTAASL